MQDTIKSVLEPLGEDNRPYYTHTQWNLYVTSKSINGSGKKIKMLS